VDKTQVARELAEELRTNTRLRHRLGMEEGTGSGVLHEAADDETTPLYLDTADGKTFAIGVVEVGPEDI
jgi:hypothetical protein